MKIRKTILLMAFAAVLSSCEDMFEPAVENYRDKEEMYDEARYALGILLNGYTRIPTNSWSFNDVATDDAVSNDPNNGYRKMATGSWSSINNPVDSWTNGFAAIQYMNIMLEESDKVKWDSEEQIREMFNDRTKGEAYALRGLFMYYLLRAHAGYTNDGQLMGVPLILNSLGSGDNYNLPRESFDKCMEQLYSDFAKAEELLPVDYNDVASDADVPEKYNVSKEDYNRVFGETSRQRMTGRIVEAMRAKAALLAASPAFNPTNDVEKWKTAADYAAQVIDRSDVTFAANGLEWYGKNGGIGNISSGNNPAEILWRNGVEGEGNSLEKDNYPPTMFGNGRINPTQNLVDAFPMKNGYPITAQGSGYKNSDPYTDRDPRLNLFIVCNGSTMGPEGEEITTLGVSTNDGVNQTETSTRTGYYMRKLLNENVNLDPTKTTTAKHFIPHIRYTEMFLTYAEAANEAYGPKNNGGHKYSAYDVIKLIRQRAGVGTDNGDPYLEECAQDAAKMRELIRNERRLELCFEGFRFWDLRRWGELDKIQESAKGINMSHEEIDVENRNYKDYMIYCPIPYNETLKWSELQQNKGW